MNSRFPGNLSSITKAILVLTTVVSASHTTPSQAAESKDTKGHDGARDMNLFQIEPTVIDERYYTSGRAERHQRTSPTLPYGAPIPDNDSVPSLEVKPTQTETKVPNQQKTEATSTATQTAVDTTAATSKLDASVQLQLSQLKFGEDKAFKLKLKCSASDSVVLKTLKEVKTVKIVSVNKSQNEIIVEAHSSAISTLSGLKEVELISPAKSDK